MTEDEPEKDDLEDDYGLAPPEDDPPPTEADPETDDRPLTLEPLPENTEVPLLDPLTGFMTAEQAEAFDEEETEEEREGAREKVQDDDGQEWVPFILPRLLPPDVRGIMTWPFGGGHGLTITGAYFLTLLGLFVAWGMGQIPILGLAFQLTALAFIAFFILPYTLHMTLASVAGAHLPPPWPSYRAEESTVAEGARMLVLLASYLAPGLVALPLVGWAVSLPLLVIGWGLFPGALLRFAGSGQLSFAHPVGALTIAIKGGTRYLLATFPGVLVIVMRYFLGDLPIAPIVESFGFFALAYTGYMAGAVARETKGVSAHLLKLAKTVEEENRLAEKLAAKRNSED